MRKLDDKQIHQKLVEWATSKKFKIMNIEESSGGIGMEKL